MYVSLHLQRLLLSETLIRKAQQLQSKLLRMVGVKLKMVGLNCLIQRNAKGYEKTQETVMINLAISRYFLY